MDHILSMKEVFSLNWIIFINLLSPFFNGIRPRRRVRGTEEGKEMGGGGGEER